MSSKAVAAEPAKSTPQAVRVTPASNRLLQRARCSCGKPIVEGGECTECQRRKLQRSGFGSSAHNIGVPSSVHSTLSSPGSPLDGGTRSAMESRFGHDFGNVRVHNDATAAQSAHDVGARAYTVGQDVVFGAGHYDPQSTSGQHLLAHELAHTIQQSGLQRSNDNISTDEGPEYQRLERDAEAVSSAAMAGKASIPTTRSAEPRLSRAPKTEKVVPGQSKKKKPITSALGSHHVTPTEGFESSQGNLQEFNVDVFYMPGTKGPIALERYRAAAGNNLETTVAMNGTGHTKTALWQKREPTDELRQRWLSNVGWTPGAADKLWARAGGDAEFPKVGKKTCQMDHIVELQLAGDNADENIQALDAAQNGGSGSDIKRELESLAKGIVADSDLADPAVDQVKMRFETVKQVGTTEKILPDCPPKNPTCLSVEECARKLKVAKNEDGSVDVARVDYPITSGGATRRLRVPTTFAGAKKETVQIKDDAVNDAAGTTIPGLLLERLAHKASGKLDVITANIDDRPETRLPISLDPAAHKKPIHLNVADDGKMAIDPADKTLGLGFTYRYLSPGRIKSINIADDGSIEWTGEITPGIPFLGKFEVSYSKGELKITKGIDEASLKKKKFLGGRITKAEISILLAPEFKPEGRVEFALGPEKNPLVTGFVSLTKDDIGLVASGKFKLNIPKVDTAELDITYKGGGSRNIWEAAIVIESSQIKVPYVKSGSLHGKLNAQGITFDGKVALDLPAGNTAELGLAYQGGGWVFSGHGSFKIPKLKEARGGISYNTATDTFTGTIEKAGFTIPSIGLEGDVSKVTVVVHKGGNVTATGKGHLQISKGKATGTADVELHENGKFTGSGTVVYQFTENLSATASVSLDDKEKLHFDGKLVIKRYQFLDRHHADKRLFDLDLHIPVPGLSLGGAGVNFAIGGGVGVGYSFGPGYVKDLTFEAKFDPLESDPDLDLGLSGDVIVEASAYVRGDIHAGVEISAVVAKVEGGLNLTGTITLQGKLSAPFNARYHQKKITAEMKPTLDIDLLLSLAVGAYLKATLGWGWLSVSTRKDWVIKQKTISTGAHLKVMAPISYDSVSGLKLPSGDDIQVEKPNIDFGLILDRLIGDDPGVEKEE